MLLLLLSTALAGALQQTVTPTLEDAVRRAPSLSPGLAAEGAVHAPRCERAEDFGGTFQEGRSLAGVHGSLTVP